MSAITGEPPVRASRRLLERAIQELESTQDVKALPFNTLRHATEVTSIDLPNVDLQRFSKCFKSASRQPKPQHILAFMVINENLVILRQLVTSLEGYGARNLHNGTSTLDGDPHSLAIRALSIPPAPSSLLETDPEHVALRSVRYHTDLLVNKTQNIFLAESWDGLPTPPDIRLFCAVALVSGVLDHFHEPQRSILAAVRNTLLATTMPSKHLRQWYKLYRVLMPDGSTQQDDILYNTLVREFQPALVGSAVQSTRLEHSWSKEEQLTMLKCIKNEDPEALKERDWTIRAAERLPWKTPDDCKTWLEQHGEELGLTHLDTSEIDDDRGIKRVLGKDNAQSDRRAGKRRRKNKNSVQKDRAEQPETAIDADRTDHFGQPAPDDFRKDVALDTSDASVRSSLAESNGETTPSVPGSSTGHQHLDRTTKKDCQYQVALPDSTPVSSFVSAAEARTIPETSGRPDHAFQTPCADHAGSPAQTRRPSKKNAKQRARSGQKAQEPDHDTKQGPIDSRADDTLMVDEKAAHLINKYIYKMLDQRILCHDIATRGGERGVYILEDGLKLAGAQFKGGAAWSNNQVYALAVAITGQSRQEHAKDPFSKQTSLEWKTIAKHVYGKSYADCEA